VNKQFLFKALIITVILVFTTCTSTSRNANERIRIDGISTTSKNNTVTSQAILNGARYDVNSSTAFRREADARIIKNRTDTITVTVLDASGFPVSDADVHVKMTKHEFLFGGSIHGTGFMTNEIRKGQFLDMFNAGVFENYMKWRWDEQNLHVSEPMLAWLLENNIPVRGHALIWGAWTNLPDLPGLPGGSSPAKLAAYEEMYKNNPAALRQLTFDRINRWVPHWGNRVTEWDVVNEAHFANDVQRILGYDMRDPAVINQVNIIDQWFREVRRISDQRNLGLKLFYNEVALLAGRGTRNAGVREWFYTFLEGLLARGVPIDGIGCQLYFANPANMIPDAAFLYECLQNLERFNLEIKVTEFGYNEQDPVKQAQTFIDLLTAVFSHHQTTSFMIWWPWDNPGGNYPHGGFFTSNNMLKPMGEAFAYLVYGKWWTDEKGKSGADGRFSTRGFFGEYDITVTHDGQTKTIPVKMFKDGERNFTVQF